MRNNLICLLLLLAVTCARAQSDESAAMAEFNKGIAFFDAKVPAEALPYFIKAGRYDDDYPTTFPARFMAAKSWYILGRWDSSLAITRRFIKGYPESPYRGDFALLAAASLTKLNRYEDAVSVLNAVLLESDSAYIREIARATLKRVIDVKFGASEIKALVENFKSTSIAPFYYLILGKFLRKIGRETEAQLAFLYILQNYPESREFSEAAALSEGRDPDAATPDAQADAVIGVVLPLQGDTLSSRAAAARDVLLGVKYAIHEFNKISARKTGLAIFPTSTQGEVPAGVITGLNAYTGLKAVIGPLFSDETKKFCTEFTSVNIPVISPTATDDELAQAFTNFYHANPTYEMRGKVMAQYIFYVENKRTVAVLWGEEGYSRLYSRAFIKEFEKLGGKIAVNESYRADGKELARAAAKLKKAKKKIEGIYLPVSDRSVTPRLLSALLQDSLFLPLYGNQEWFGAKALESSTRLGNLMTIESDYFINFQDSAFIEFSRAFSEVTGSEVNRSVLYGYDTATWLLGLLGSSLQEPLLPRLRAALPAAGWHNNITIGTDKINRNLNIVRFRDGYFELTDRFKYEE